MFTDPVPRAEARRREYEKSERLLDVALPAPSALQTLTVELADAMAAERTGPVASAAMALVEELAGFYKVAVPPVRVLGVRPHRVTDGVCTYQLYGDYSPQTQRIRVWMRTAIRAQVSTPKSFLATLLHEFCHHLDCTALGCPNTFHTRGFYTRIDRLYHHALGTPPAARRPLRWIRRGSVWAMSWQRSPTRRTEAR